MKFSAEVTQTTHFSNFNHLNLSQNDQEAEELVKNIQKACPEPIKAITKSTILEKDKGFVDLLYIYLFVVDNTVKDFLNALASTGDEQGQELFAKLVQNKDGEESSMTDFNALITIENGKLALVAPQPSSNSGLRSSAKNRKLPLSSPSPSSNTRITVVGDTPLCVAARSGNIRAVEWLIGSGAKTTVKGLEGNSPLHCAVIGRHANICKV